MGFVCLFACLLCLYHFPPKLENSSPSDSDPEHRMALYFELPCTSYMDLTSFHLPGASMSTSRIPQLFLSLLRKKLKFSFSLDRTRQVLSDILALTYKMCLRKHGCPEICKGWVFHPESCSFTTIEEGISQTWGGSLAPRCVVFTRNITRARQYDRPW